MKNKNLDYIVLNYANEDGAGFESNTNYCSNKSGKNLQFVLGNINELDRSDNLEWIQNKDNCRRKFNKNKYFTNLRYSRTPRILSSGLSIIKLVYLSLQIIFLKNNAKCFS